MLNLGIGSELLIDGRRFIRTHDGSVGHAVWGPYTPVQAGAFIVGFDVSTVPGSPDIGDDEVCAVVDATTDFGRNVLASAPVTGAQLRDRTRPIGLRFDLSGPDILECRVHVNGRAPLVIGEFRRIVRLAPDEADPMRLLVDSRFPDTSRPDLPQLMRDDVGIFGRLFDRGVVVRIVDGHLVLTVESVSIHARVADDLRFLEEVFFNAAYNVLAGRDLCVIDIGMNIGLASLYLASKPNVREVHSFEPFRTTFDRAVANIELNPGFGGKIRPHDFGLAGENAEREVLIANENDSGQFSVRGAQSGQPASISVKDAADVLRPIIEDARRRGLQVVAKVDCEGSEYDIFETLERAGLLGQITAFMVEWHNVVAGKSQLDLIAPLLRHGYVVFDLKTGIGFFYAVRSAS